MKKILVLLLALSMLCACGKKEETDVKIEANSDLVEIVEQETSFSMDDFAFYDENGALIMALEQPESVVDLTNERFREYYSLFDVGFREYIPKNKLDVAESTMPNIISMLNYKGNTKIAMTCRGIATAGYTNPLGLEVSSEKDIINAYGLKPEEESIYSNILDEKRHTIILFFKRNEDGTIERLVYDKDCRLEEVYGGYNYCLQFIIEDEKVMGILMNSVYSTLE